MRRELRWKRKGYYRLFFFLVMLPMLLVFPYIRAVNNPNEFVRVYTVMSLVESHTFRIDEQVATFGWTNDMAHLKLSDGIEHYTMVKAPGVVYAGVPGYWLFSKVIAPMMGHHYPGIYGGIVDTKTPKIVDANVGITNDERLWWLRMSTWVMRIFSSQIPCFLFLLWFEKYLRDYSPDPAIRYSAVAAAGLGTNFLAYVHMFASHSQYACVAFIAFATIEKELRRSDGDIKRMRFSRAFFAGFCTSACVTLEYHALFMTVIMSLFATFTFFSPLRAFYWVFGWLPPFHFLHRRIPLGASVTPTRLIAFAVGGLLNIPHMMYFHWAAYGNPYTPGHQKMESAKFAAEHNQGLWGILWPTWDHIRAIAIDPGFGFFGMSPYMWIGLLGIPLVLISPRGAPGRRTHLRVVTIVWLALMTMVFGVNAGFIEWRAGWTVGPRYLVVCAPFFAFGAVLALERFAHGNRSRRALARGIAGGLALAGVVTIGTVGLIYDTLPETIARPFAQFSIPMMRVGQVPHHIGEWFGWDSSTLWYIACGAMLLAPMIAGLWKQPGEKRGEIVGRMVAFVMAFAIGMVPAFSPPEDGTKLFVLHPSTIPLGQGMEPPYRDRITHLREEAERFGPRGKGPCLYYEIAELERAMNQDVQASHDDAKAKITLPKDRCPKTYF